MNTIQQISLKLQLGLDPLSEIRPDLLRAMWRKDLDRRYGSGWIARREKALACSGDHKSAMNPLR